MKLSFTEFYSSTNLLIYRTTKPKSTFLLNHLAYAYKGNLINIFHKYNGALYRGAPKDDFLLNTLRLKTFLGYPEYCILCRAMKICVSVRSSYGNLNLFEITRASVLLSRKFKRQFNALTKMRIFLIPLSIIFSNPKVLGFLFSTKNSLT